MDWEQAKEWEIQNWTAIRDAIGIWDPMAVRTCMNRAGNFCRLSRLLAESRGETSVCGRCPACEQFGGCEEVRKGVYEALVVGEVARARAIVDEFLAHLAELEIPDGLTASSGR